MIAKGIKAALNLSSGYHIPLRILRHLITVWSEMWPTMEAPTVKKGYVSKASWSENGVDYEPMLPTPKGRRQAPISASFVM